MLRTFLTSLKAALDNGDWLGVLLLVSDLIKLVSGPAAASAEDATAELDAVEASVVKAKTSPHAQANAGAIDPNDVFTLIGLVLKMIKDWRKK